eukprot:2438683-Heterocapsa_arctica.AAC.1
MTSLLVVPSESEPQITSPSKVSWNPNHPKEHPVTINLLRPKLGHYMKHFQTPAINKLPPAPPKRSPSPWFQANNVPECFYPATCSPIYMITDIHDVFACLPGQNLPGNL